jgi:hypothetical protein
VEDLSSEVIPIIINGSKFFSISIISVEYERVFSSVKILIIDRRNDLKEDIIEVCILLKYWFREAGFI